MSQTIDGGNQHDNVPTSSNNNNNNDENDINDDRVMVPPDPRSWDATHIRSWLKWMDKQCRNTAALDVKNFPNCGAELTRMSLAEFVVSAQSRCVGKMLAMHVAHLMQQMTGSCAMLHETADPGMND